MEKLYGMWKTLLYFMAKKGLNQNGIYIQELIDTIEPNFFFSNKPVKRFKDIITKKLSNTHNNSVSTKKN